MKVNEINISNGNILRKIIFPCVGELVLATGICTTPVVIPGPLISKYDIMVCFSRNTVSLFT